METKKSLIIDIATSLFQQKGYKSVGLNELMRACKISKGALYHHFPHGKEELLIACLQSLNDAITKDIEEIFARYPNAPEAIQAMIHHLMAQFEANGTLSGYTFSSIVSEMASFNNPVRDACAQLYRNMQDINMTKLMADGISQETARSMALLITASIEGGMMLCRTQNSAEPLGVIAQELRNRLKEINK